MTSIVSPLFSEANVPEMRVVTITPAMAQSWLKRTSKAPVVGNVHMALDRNSRRTVSLEPKAGSIVIESAQDSAASVAKRQRIARGVK